MRIENGKVVLESANCRYCRHYYGDDIRPGQIREAVRVPCPRCHGTGRTKGGKGKGRCTYGSGTGAPCFFGEVVEFCEIYEVRVSLKKEVCPVCKGHGTHVNPAIDSHGISSEEFWDDPDFEEGYFSGRYDVRCNRCHGLRVVDTIDFENCPPGTEDLWNEYQNDVQRWPQKCG